MRVQILKVSMNELVGATIREGRYTELPSINGGWKFSFDRHSRTLLNAKAYILTANETTEEVEGCMIFQMIGTEVPYMALLEIAPHNRANPKRYDYVAGCLIAYACRLSLTLGKGDYLGWLTFDVAEKDTRNQVKIMAVYSKKYGAVRYINSTTMLIDPIQAGRLLKQYF